MATNLPSCFLIQFLEQLLTFLVNFTLLKYVKSQRSYGFLTIKGLIFGFQILDLLLSLLKLKLLLLYKKGKKISPGVGFCTNFLPGAAFLQNLSAWRGAGI